MTQINSNIARCHYIYRCRRAGISARLRLRSFPMSHTLTEFLAFCLAGIILAIAMVVTPQKSQANASLQGVTTGSAVNVVKKIRAAAPEPKYLEAPSAQLKIIAIEHCPSNHNCNASGECGLTCDCGALCHYILPSFSQRLQGGRPLQWLTPIFFDVGRTSSPLDRPPIL